MTDNYGARLYRAQSLKAHRGDTPVWKAPATITGGADVAGAVESVLADVLRDGADTYVQILSAYGGERDARLIAGRFPFGNTGAGEVWRVSMRGGRAPRAGSYVSWLWDRTDVTAAQYTRSRGECKAMARGALCGWLYASLATRLPVERLALCDVQVRWATGVHVIRLAQGAGADEPAQALTGVGVALQASRPPESAGVTIYADYARPPAPERVTLARVQALIVGGGAVSVAHQAPDAGGYGASFTYSAPAYALAHLQGASMGALIYALTLTGGAQ